MKLEILLVIVVVIGLAVLLAILLVCVASLRRLKALHRLLSDPLMPFRAKVVFWGAVAYTIFPLDVIPDPIYLDDAGFLALAATSIAAMARRRAVALPAGFN